jgi:hypothetical protein
MYCEAGRIRIAVAIAAAMAHIERLVVAYLEIRAICRLD